MKSKKEKGAAGGGRVLLDHKNPNKLDDARDNLRNATRAYDCAAVQHFGEFAHLDFPEEWPPERRAEVYAQRDAAEKSVGATHASPVPGKGKSKKTEAGRRKAKG